MRQLPLRLLRSAAAGSLRSPTLSRGGCPVPLAPHLSAEAAATPAELARWLPRRGYSRFASGITPLEPKKLGSILDVERAKGLSPEHLVAAWDDPIFCYSFVERKWMYHHVYARSLPSALSRPRPRGSFPLPSAPHLAPPLPSPPATACLHLHASPDRRVHA
ncbi:uncharacterized protein [Triticum aestivum]|uniref:uncharacterized protein isoform X2 n=1 Tax=Triticum aestivum TaxID=4565 RepID=UPI001D03208B|nr:uncharacterized protein LOC123102781 isoform X2 [Triticum aestivum]